MVAGACVLATTGNIASADSPEPWQWLFQDSATSTHQAMVDLHHVREGGGLHAPTTAEVVCWKWQLRRPKGHEREDRRHKEAEEGGSLLGV